MAKTANLDSFFSPTASSSSSKRPPPDPSPPPSPSPRKHPRTAKGTSKSGGAASKGKGKASAKDGEAQNLGEMVLDDSEGEDDADDLIIVGPPAGSDSLKPSATITGSGAKPGKAPPPVASIFQQKKAPASPVQAASAVGKDKGKGKGKGKELQTPRAKKEDMEVEEDRHDEDVKPDVKPALASPLKTISIFDTQAASSSASTSAAAASTSTSAAPGLTLHKPLDTPLFSFDPHRDVAFPPPPPGQPQTVPFSFFTQALLLISGTRSRLLIRLVMTNLLRCIIVHSPSSLLPTLYLLSNRIAPSYERGTELGVGWQVLSKGIKETSGISGAKLKQLGNKLGDPGDIAFEASRTVRLLVRPKELTVDGVYGTLRAIAKLKGTGVLQQKTSLVKKLLLSAQGEEVRYVVRILVANLRIGAVRLTLLSALARAFCLVRAGGGEPREEVKGDGSEGEGEEGEGAKADQFWVTPSERARLAALEVPPTSASPSKSTSKSKKPAPSKASKHPLSLEIESRFAGAEAVVRRAYARHPNMGHLVEALMGQRGGGGGIAAAETVGVSVGIPLEPMLGSITRSLADVYTKLGNRPFVSESKLDGQRGQIHVWVTDASTSTATPSSSSALPSFVAAGEGAVKGARPPGVEPGAGIVYSGEDLPGLAGKKVWVRTFSRHLEDMSEKYPDIVGTMAAIVARSASTDTPLTNFILDCEVVAIDPNSGAFKTFQELSYRSKKDVELGDIKVRVGIYAFDLMLLNNESLLSSPFRRRRTLLRSLFPALRPSDARLAKFELIPSCESTELADVREFFEECVRGKAEGIMVKLLDEIEVEVDVEGEGEAKEEGGEDEAEDAAENDDGSSGSESGSRTGSGSEKGKADEGGRSKGGGGRKGRRKVLPATYEPDKRADSWCKVKKDYLEDLGDSLDLVPIGAWYGQGRKNEWWSPFLLAVYDADTGLFTAVSKCLSGFTDAFYKEYKVKYNEDPENPLTSKECWPEVEAGGLRPDIWFQPTEVWEVRGADFTLSPVYPAARAQLGGERGVSIRFPRFIKRREDKSVEHATTAEQLAELYQKQGEVEERPGRTEEREEEGGADE
ncbi:hypothetical protein JCM6882_006892 [Rhodosporidiobolus microsporus]